MYAYICACEGIIATECDPCRAQTAAQIIPAAEDWWV